MWTLPFQPVWGELSSLLKIVKVSCAKKRGGVEGSTKFSSANFKAEFSSAFPPFPLLEVFRAFYLSLVKL